MKNRILRLAVALAVLLSVGSPLWALSKKTVQPAAAPAPLMTVLEPEDKLVTTQDSVILSLQLAPQTVSLLVNDQPVIIPAGGSVKVKINLQGVGKHLVKIAAQDGHDQELVIERRILRTASLADVPADSWASKSINDLVTLGVFDLSGNDFNPQENVSRDQIAVWLVRAGNLVMSEVTVSPFKDVPASSPLAPYIVTVSTAGLISGYSDKTFRPDRQLSRAEEAGIIGKFAGLTPAKPAQPPFSDLALNSWVTPWAAALKDRGWLDFLNSGKFLPDQKVAKAEVAWLLSQVPSVQARITDLYGWDQGFVMGLPAAGPPKAAGAAPAAGAEQAKAEGTSKPDEAAVDLWVRRPEAIPDKVAPARPISISPPAAAKPAFPSKISAISMDFRDVELANVLRVFSQETGINVVAGPDVRGKVTVSFVKVDPQKALDLILRVNGFTYTLKDSIVIVEPTGKTNPLGRADTAIRSFEIEYGKATDISDTIGKLISPVGEVYVNDRQNVLIVRDTPENLDKIAEVIGTLDAAPLQVLVQAAVVQTKVGTGEKLGVDWRLNRGIVPGTSSGESALQPTYKPFGQTTPTPDTWANKDTAAGAYGLATPFKADTPTGGLYVDIITQGFQAYLTAVKSLDKSAAVLAQPKLMTVDGETAQILIGNVYGYKTTTTTGSSVQENVSFIEGGTKLVFTPHISRDGYILMEIHPEVSTPAIIGGLPQKEGTECTTKVLVKDGETIVIGGLIQKDTNKTESGVPFLSDIPFLGALFRKTDAGVNYDTEITVFITPTIITRGQVAAMQSEVKTATDKAKQKAIDNSKIFRP